MSNSEDKWSGWSDENLKGAARILGDMLDAIGPIGNPQAARQHLLVCNEMAYRDAMALLPRMVMVSVNGRERMDPEWELLQTGDDASARGQM